MPQALAFIFFWKSDDWPIFHYYLVVIACHDKIVLYTARFIEMNMEELT